MKVFVLVNNDTGKVEAISEDEKDIRKYMKSSKLGNNYFYTWYKGSITERILIDFEDLYLEEDDKLHIVLTRAERKLLSSTIDDEINKVQSVANMIDHMITNYELSKKDRKVLQKAFKTMTSFQKKKKMKEVFGVGKILEVFEKNDAWLKALKTNINNMTEMYYIFVKSDRD